MNDEVNARWCVVAMMALTFAVNIPLLVTTTVYGDDWAWVWVNHFQGAAKIREYMWQIAHPGYGPFFNLWFWLGGDEPGRVARASALAVHLGSGWLLWRIFLLGRVSPAFAATVAVLYLASPFLGGIRGTLSHAEYDVFIFSYLLSIRFSVDRRLIAVAGAVVALFVGLSLETLLALEALRWWLLYQNGYRGRKFIYRVAPFAAVVLAVAISRVTWLVPYGEVYASHNTMKAKSLSDLAFQIALHCYYYVQALEPIRYVASLVAYENVIVTLLLAAAAAVVGILYHRVKTEPRDRDLVILFGLGLVVLGLGMLPYVLIQRAPNWVNTYSRFVVASQFGAFILMACFIHALRGRLVRAAALGLAAFVFAGMQVQLGKWMMYDELIVADLQRQLGDRFKANPPELLILRFPQDSHEVFYIKRCLANYDINVALDIAGTRHGSFAYDRDCDGEEYTKEGKCGVTGFDPVPCPAIRRTAEFRLRPEMERFTRLRIVDLAKQVMTGAPVQTGSLVIDPAPGAARPAGAAR
jgi:hypothetical protein